MDEIETFYRLVERRRSVREFAERPVEPEKLERLLRTLNRAQSAANRQPWHFIVVESEGRGELNEVFTKDGFKRAPVVVVACAEPGAAWVRKTDNINYSWVDVTIAVTEMIGAATAEGLGTCWIAAIDAARVKRILGVPGGIEIVGVIAIGYPAEELKRAEKARKPLEEIVHYGRWHGKKR
ncbi:MAG TPA: nitroreductase family protein [Thermodesulfobacteriota bacterium]|nr:nitroreductase family protein [Thermodesulfobacteriota bacterium]